MTETAPEHWFQRLAAAADTETPVAGEGAAAWYTRRTAEVESLRVTGPAGTELFLVAGRQIVTAEGLEVLALGTVAEFSDGATLPAAVQTIRAAKAVAVVPWGFGKWWGRRGALLRAYLESLGDEVLYLGDTRGRLRGTPDPRPFQLATARGWPILPGSDPLPMASEAVRPGSYGFALEATLDAARPWTSLRQALDQCETALEVFGERETAARFMRNQVFMQYDKRRRGAQAGP